MLSAEIFTQHAKCKLMLYVLENNFSSWHFEIFSHKNESLGDILHEMSKSIFWER